MAQVLKLTPRIVKLFKQGNQIAYQHIFHHLYTRLCLFANKYLNSKDEAEDVCQEVFIELWYEREKFESINHIKSFLYLSVKNSCINLLKHQKVKSNYNPEHGLDIIEINTEQEVIRSEVISIMYDAIESLSKQRKDIILLHLQGLKNIEIAKELKVSVNTIKLQKRIAYQKLRESLKHCLPPFLFIHLFLVSIIHIF